MSAADEGISASAFLAELAAHAEDWQARGLRRTRRVIEGPVGARLELVGRGRHLAFLSNDYLGLASHPDLRAAVARSAEQWGAGSGSSALISGHLRCHAEAEAAVAEFLATESALLFITGYMANLAAVSCLLDGPEDVVFSDALNHASLIDGCRLSRARIMRYPHLDTGALAESLALTPARRRLIVTDAVFSMDGDVADLGTLLALAERFDALLLVDDAHGFGVLGPQGRGSLAAAALSSPRLLVMGTLGKAAGLSGAFVAGSTLLVDHLVQHGRSYVFSTAPAPAVAGAVPQALALIGGGDQRRARLHRLRSELCAQGAAWRRPPPAGATPIVPIVVGKAQEAMRLTDALAAQGVLVAGIRPPTVAAGSSRLRISLSAAHESADIDALVIAGMAVGL